MRPPKTSENVATQISPKRAAAYDYDIVQTTQMGIKWNSRIASAENILECGHSDFPQIGSRVRLRECTNDPNGDQMKFPDCTRLKYLRMSPSGFPSNGHRRTITRLCKRPKWGSNGIPGLHPPKVVENVATRISPKLAAAYDYEIVQTTQIGIKWSSRIAPAENI